MGQCKTGANLPSAGDLGGLSAGVAPDTWEIQLFDVSRRSPGAFRR